MGYSEPSAKLEAAEAFSIGLTCMDAALLEDSDSLYGSHKDPFNTRALQ